MNRYEIDVRTTTQDLHRYIMETEVEDVGLPIHFDNELLFWGQHFDGHKWATYDNGHQKGGTLRFKEGLVRVPSNYTLEVYESNEFKQEPRFPRANVRIEKVTVCQAGYLSKEELTMDGFENHDHMMESMASYYPTITLDSFVSFYTFGKTEWLDKKDFNYDQELNCWIRK